MDCGIIKGNGTESGRIITTKKKGLNDQKDKVTFQFWLVFFVMTHF